MSKGVKKRDRKQDKLPKSEYRLLFRLLQDQPWLAERYEQLEKLSDECENHNELLLVIDLLSRFVYLTRQAYKDILSNVVDTIISDWKLDKDYTQIVAATVDNQPDSGQLLVYDFRSFLAKCGWKGNVVFGNTINKVTAYIPDRPIIVIVDEFIGSGQSIKGRIEELERRVRDKAPHVDPKFYVVVIASMSEGMEVLKPLCVDIKAGLVLTKGISDHYDSKGLPSKISDMERLESILKGEIQTIPLPHFGYNRAEALYGREDGNSPNSVFPVFWWPSRNDDECRDTILTRATIA